MTDSAPAAPPAVPDPATLLRDRRYVAFLLLGALVGVPVATLAYFFLKAVQEGQHFFFTDLPVHLGFASEPAWWPILPLVVCGATVPLVIRYLPGNGGHSPADGFAPPGPLPPVNIIGVVLAALLTLCLGAVLGPEAPLIAIGSGMGVLVLHLVKRDAPDLAAVVVGAAGSFAAVSTLFGSPIAAAFLLMEAAGLGAGLLSVLLVPGLLAAGIGSLMFIGLNSWVGFGSFSLVVTPIPHVGAPDGWEFLWAVGFGVAGALLGSAVRRAALLVRAVVEPRMVVLTPLVGLAVAGLAIAYGEGTGKSSSDVLFSGQFSLPGLVQRSSTYTVGALLLLLVCKSLAYSLSLSSFRGGPIFPALFVGATGGIAAAHGPALTTIAGAAMGMGVMTVAMLGLPLTAVLLVTVLLAPDAADVMPLVIVAVVVAYVASARLAPSKKPTAAPSPSEEAPSAGPAVVAGDAAGGVGATSS